MPISVPFHGGELDSNLIEMDCELDDTPNVIRLNEDDQNGIYFKTEDPTGKIHYVHQSLKDIFHWRRTS